jgi:hypothetical protein
VIAKFYTRINTKRLLQLLDLSELVRLYVIAPCICSKEFSLSIIDGVFIANRGKEKMPELDVCDKISHVVSCDVLFSVWHLVYPPELVYLCVKPRVRYSHLAPGGFAFGVAGNIIGGC